MSKAKQYCSILNYVRHENDALNELLQDLCLSKLLVPRSKDESVTFLCPNDVLTKELVKMANGENPEKAVDIIKSLVLTDLVPNLEVFNGVVPTRLDGRAVSVKEHKGKTVHLAGGCVIADAGFKPRKDRPNIAVYTISGEFPELGNEPVESKRGKTGGADLGEGAIVDRHAWFVSVLEKFCSGDKDPAYELLAAMYAWATSASGNPGVAAHITQKASHDSLATLAIIMRPFSENKEVYVGDGDLVSIRNFIYGEAVKNKSELLAFKNTDHFATNSSMLTNYDEVLKGTNNKDSFDKLKKESNSLSRNLSKLTAVKELTNWYKTKHPQINQQVLFAEAELRVLSATMLGDTVQAPNLWELYNMYSNCNLDRPYLCTMEMVKAADLGFYYSTVYLIARSDALDHVPHETDDTASIEKITDENAFFSMHMVMRSALRDRKENSKYALSRFSKSD